MTFEILVFLLELLDLGNRILGRRFGSTFVACGSKTLTSALAEDAVAPAPEAVDVDSQFARDLADGASAVPKQVDRVPAKFLSVGVSGI